MSAPLPQLDTIRIAVIGLGYVGLPLSINAPFPKNILAFDVFLVAAAIADKIFRQSSAKTPIF